MNVVVKKARNGKGVFAYKDFKKGEIILKINGKILDYDNILDNSKEDDKSIQINERNYVGPSGKEDDFINHSCDPNAYLDIKEKVQLIALKNIKKGEEITFDYSTNMNEDHWQMKCNCGAVNCRKLIRDFKYLPFEIKNKYIKQGIIPEFIIQAIG